MDNLQAIRENTIEQIKENLGVVASGSSMISIGREIEETCGLFQTLASCNLLLSMDNEAFGRNLVFSGCTRRYYLDRSRIEGNQESIYLAISRTEGFLDALVARDNALAFDIVRLSPDDWFRDGEYEDDYCYVAFLHHYAVHSAGADRIELQRLLDRFEDALEGVTSPRIDVCRALFDNDSKGFAENFELLLQAHETWGQENENILGYDPVFQLRRRIFIEGLAVLVLADRNGLPTEDEYQFCPSIARVPAETDRAHEDIFIEIDRIAAEERRAPSEL